MFKNEKIKVYIFLFLTFCVLSSKSIIIYNEETLVALSFFTFVLFCFNYFGNTIKESLDERADTIRGELQNFLHLKEESLQKLAGEHKRVARLKSILPALGGFTEQELFVSSSSGLDTLNSIFAQQIQQKLGQLVASKSTLQERLQKLIAENIRVLVLTKLEQNKILKGDSLFDPQLVKKSIQLLK